MCKSSHWYCGLLDFRTNVLFLFDGFHQKVSRPHSGGVVSFRVKIDLLSRGGLAAGLE